MSASATTPWAEVQYDGAWHVIDADSFGGDGRTVTTDDGTIPSVRALSNDADLVARLDALPYGIEPLAGARPNRAAWAARSVGYFGRDTGRRGYFVKPGPPEQGDLRYGWRRLQRSPPDWIRRAGPERSRPGAVAILAATIGIDSATSRLRASLAWSPPDDFDRDALAYRVFVGSRPRGWNYDVFEGTDDARRAWHRGDGWRPEMIDALYGRPPHDVALLETTAPAVLLDLDPGRAHYATVMPLDAYHESVGRELYPMSNELTIGPA